MNEALKQTVTVVPNVLSQVVNGETVLLDLNSESYFGLDVTGSAIWQELQAHGDLQKVYEHMLQEYDVDGPRLEKDLLDLVNRLVDAGLVKREANES